MKAYKCDVCDALFYRESVPNVTVQEYIHGYGTDQFDLCPECQKQLEDFLWARRRAPLDEEKLLSDKYAAIVFAPVCSNCKNVILGEVDYKDVEPLPTSRDNSRVFRMLKAGSFTPEKCPYCGAIIRLITIPSRLAQTTEKLFEYAESRLKDEVGL